MRNYLTCIALASLALCPGCSCGSKSESSSSSSPEPEKLPPPVRIGVDGGKIERGSARIEFPKGALGREQDVHFDEARPRLPVSYKPAGKPYLLLAEQATFAAPVKVTLPLDIGSLPSDVKAEHIYVVLAYNGMGEVLENAKVDLEARTVTVMLERAFSLASGDAAGSGAGPVLQPAVNPGGIDTLEVTPRIAWCAAHGLEKADVMLAKGKAIMKLVRQNYDPLGMVNLGQTTFTFKPMNPAWGGLTTGANSVEVNSDKFLTYDEQTQGSVFMHEYFHMLQLKTIAQNVRSLATPLPGDYFLRGKTEWLKEATATWMQENMSKADAAINIPRLEPNFCYIPLNGYEDSTKGNPHQYAAYIFFSWLDSMYSSRQVIARAWQESFSGKWVQMAGLEQDAGQGRGTFNPLDILDHILRETPDSQGRQRNLREVYAEFLLHYGWLKDFAPLKGNAQVRSVLGAPKEITLVGDKTTSWTLPFEEGGKRVTKKSETVTGEGFHIARAFMIAKGLKGGEKGDLEVTLKLGERGDPRDSMIVVFPLKKNAEDPVIGNAGSPAKIRNWHETNGAIVWLVDMSVTGQAGLAVTADVKDGDEMSFVLEPQIPKEPYTETMAAHAGFMLSFAAPAGIDPKTPEGRKQFDPIADKWAKILENERNDRTQWIHLVATIDGRKQHYYGRIGNTNPPALSIFGGKFLLPRKAGTFQVEVKGTFRGQALSVTYPVTVKLPDWRQPAADDSIRQKIGEIEALKAKGAGPEYLASAYLGLGGHYESIWRDEAAIEAWNKGLALAVDDGQRNLFIESIARNAFQRGDMDAFLAGMEKLKQQVSYQDVAEWVLAIEGKPGKAKLLKAKVPDIKEEELERFRQWPNDGDEIAE